MRDDGERVADILEAAERIATRVARGRDTFDRDEDVRLAIVRLLEIVGEAATGLSAEFRAAHGGVPWSLIVGMRNRIVHAYFGVDHDVVWRTVSGDLPRLVQQLRQSAAGEG